MASCPSSKSATTAACCSSSGSCSTSGDRVLDPNAPDVRAAVSDAYGKVARGTNSQAIGGSGAVSCCGSSADVDLAAYAQQLGYSADDVSDALAGGANLGLGCGNPVALASLSEGETVIDLGSGAGFDCFLAAKRVGPTGRVIGVDMTAAMVQKARANAATKNITNVTFEESTIEALALRDNIADAVISNCVINLSPAKQKVLNEAFRVLKPGGRFVVSDIVATRELTPTIRNDLNLYTGCMAGATPVNQLEAMLREAGFVGVKIEVKEDSKSYIGKWAPGSNAEDYVASAMISAYKAK